MRLFANFGTSLDIVINRLIESYFQFFDIICVEADDVSNTSDMSDKDFIVRIILKKIFPFVADKLQYKHGISNR